MKKRSFYSFLSAAVPVLALLFSMTLSGCGTPNLPLETTLPSETTELTTGIVPGTLPPQSETEEEQTTEPTGSQSETSSDVSSEPVTDTSASETTEEETSADTDPTDPSSSDVPPSKPADFPFSPYDTTPEMNQVCSKTFLKTWCDLADAYLGYETEFSCPDEETFEMILLFLPTAMPYFGNDAVISYDSYDPSSGKVSIHYLSQTKEEHDALYQKFLEQIDSVCSEIEEGDSCLTAAITLYRSFCSFLPSYLSTSGHDPNESDFYSSAMFAYLLRHIGIKADMVVGYSHTADIDHYWTVFELDGKSYYADPMFESGETAGYGLSYFALTPDERAEEGFNLPDITFGISGMCDDLFSTFGENEFIMFRGCTSYEINRVNKTLLLTYDDTEDQTFTLTDFPGGMTEI